MKKLEGVYRLGFYLICFILLVTAVMKFGGALNKTKVGLGEVRIRLDHLFHAIAYFIFSLYHLAGRKFGFELFKKYSFPLFFISVFLVGLLSEIIQIWVPYRTFSLMDMMSNLVGIGLGYVVTIVFLRRDGGK
jgi:VanZ family protein